MTLKEIFETIARLTGKSPPRIRLPHNLILPIAYLLETIATFTKKEPLATVDGVRMAKKKMFFTSKRAEIELGYRHRPAVEAIKDAVEWFKQKGLLQGSVKRIPD